MSQTQSVVSDTVDDKQQPTAISKKVEQIVNGKAKALQRFVRSRTERPFTVPKRSNFIKSYYQPQVHLKASGLYGSFKPDDCIGSFTIAGMHIQHDLGQFVDYIVHKAAGSNKQINATDKKSATLRYLKMDKTAEKRGIERPLNKTPTEYTLRLCNSDSVYDHMRMLREVSLMKMIEKRIENKRLQGHFLKHFEVGTMKKLLYWTTRKNSQGRETHIMFELTPRPNPRPFFIFEAHFFSFENLIKLSKTNSIEMNSARHLAVGTLHTLRVLHQLGYVHRCVSPQTFGLRKELGGRYLSDRVKCQSMWYVRRYDRVQPRKRGPFVGSYTFSSLEAQNGMEHIPNDDLISTIYMFVYLCLGHLPWMRPKNTNDIWDEKEAFQSLPKQFPAPTNVEYNIDKLSDAFAMINCHNPYVNDWLVYKKLIDLLGTMVEENTRNIKKDECFILGVGRFDLDDMLLTSDDK